MSVRPERADNQKNCHSRKQKSAGSEIVVLIPEEKVYHYHRHIGEPQQVGDDKYFAKRNEVIRSEMDQPIVACHGLLEIGKPQHIYDPVKDKRQRVSVLLIEVYKCFL